MAGVLARSVSLHLYAFCLYLVMNFSNSSEVNLPGHMKKLGLQRKSEGHVEILHELPTPLEFYDKYVREGKPVVFKGAAKEMPAYKNWNDEYLRTKYGDLKFDVEEGKKENRSLRTFFFTMKDFVEKYKTEDVYMVHSIHQRMREDVTLLPILSCGGYVNLLQDIVMWFSSGGTKSVLHSDNVDNINCVFSGEKELYVVDKAYQRHVLFDAPGYSKVDPDAVNLKKYPGLAEAPWWEVKVEAGDCLFIPLEWIHQVRSFNRSIAVNVWFTHPLKINTSDCEGKNQNAEYTPLSKFPLKSNAGAKQLLLLEVKEKGKMTLKEFHKFLKVALEGEKSNIEGVLKIVDKNSDRWITPEDIDALTDEDLVTIRRLMPMGADMEEDEGAEHQDTDAENSNAAADDFDDATEQGDGVGGEDEGKEEMDEDDIGDGFPYDVQETDSKDADEVSAHTEL